MASFNTIATLSGYIYLVLDYTVSRTKGKGRSKTAAGV